MACNQPCWHSFDGGKVWHKGRPSPIVESQWPGTLKVRFSEEEPPARET